MSDDLNQILGIEGSGNASPSTLPTVRPSMPILVLSVGILAAFFMPWFQLLGEGLSGYQLGKLGSYGNYAWIVPVLAAMTIVVSLCGVSNRLSGVITGLFPIFGLIYAISRISSEIGPRGSDQFFEVAQHIVSIGVYLTLAFSVGLLICAFLPASANSTQSIQNAELPPPSQDVLTQLERLGGLRAQGILTEAEFEDQKKQILG
jgi:hypothetical protein